MKTTLKLSDSEILVAGSQYASHHQLICTWVEEDAKSVYKRKIIASCASKGSFEIDWTKSFSLVFIIYSFVYIKVVFFSASWNDTKFFTKAVYKYCVYLSRTTISYRWFWNWNYFKWRREYWTEFFSANNIILKVITINILIDRMYIIFPYWY